MILALDLGTNCGWAIDDGISTPSGSWDLTPSRGDSPGMRYLKLRARLEEVLRAYPRLSLVVYEQVSVVTIPGMHGAVHQSATKIAMGLAAHVESWCCEGGRLIDHTTVHVNKLKKWATGSGRANKADMRRLGRMRFAGLDACASDDEVDARWVLAWAHENYRIAEEAACQK